MSKFTVMTEFTKWIKGRKAISIRRLEIDTGIPANALHKYIKGERTLADKHRPKLLKLAKTYGFQGNEI